jgi:hypothetical protein
MVQITSFGRDKPLGDLWPTTQLVIGTLRKVLEPNIEPTDDGKAAALRELTSIQYFSECSNKHRAWAWDALNAIDPELAELAANNPKAAFDKCRGG